MSRLSLVKKIKNISFLRTSFSYVIYGLLRIIFFTYRLKIENDFSQQKLQDSFKQGIFYFWHQDIIGGSFFFFKNKLRGHCIVSPSRDGKIMGFVAEKLGFTVLYGSSHKRTVGLVKDSLDVLEKHKRIALIGDGSRGPALKLQKGIMFLAAKSQLPLIFIECKISRSFIFKKSWDKFRMPLPFSKISVKVHSPVIVTEQDYKNF
jgi:Kdo2-lipid IVA 3' secondary acyltransferase